MTDRALLRSHGLFEARTPRYTSYPAAPHFSPEVGPGMVDGWLSDLPDGTAISAYVHIPFCRRLCWFCACRTQGTLTDAPLRPYLDALKVEIGTVADRLDAPRLSRLHLGGGTPTILPAVMIHDLGSAMIERFDPLDETEISVEIDPTVLGSARLDALAAIGVSRASIGVQDFAPRVQRAIGREQSLSQTEAAVDGLRARGIGALNLDLLYGLPFQTEASLLATLDAALSLNPDRIAFFGYAHVPWASRRQVMIPTDALPAPEARLDLFEAASERLRAAGFVALGIDHFARPSDPLAVAAVEGRMRRNFQGYTDDLAETLIGFGASSISKYPQGYAQNDPATAGWSEAASAGRLTTVRGHALGPRDRREGAVIEALLCGFAADAAVVADRAACTLPEAWEVLTTVVDAWPDLVARGSEGITLRPQAHPMVRQIAQTADAYAAPAGRHSLAV